MVYAHSRPKHYDPPTSIILSSTTRPYRQFNHKNVHNEQQPHLTCLLLSFRSKYLDTLEQEPPICTPPRAACTTERALGRYREFGTDDSRAGTGYAVLRWVCWGNVYGKRKGAWGGEHSEG